ncbi:MAG: outer membrane beta-barrel domain-containing protein [Myxococcota bacterium]
MLTAVLFFTTPILAQEIDDDEEDELPYASVVVQNRKNLGTHELSVGFGVLALDAFTKGITASGSYTIHFNEIIGWEVAQFVYSFHVDTDLKSELETFELRPTPFELLDYYAMTNLLIKPIYWKGSWFNNSLIYGEIFFVVGGGYGWYTRSSRPGADVGVGLRLFGNSLLSFRFDLRYLAFFDDSILEDFEARNDLWANVGVSLTF